MTLAGTHGNLIDMPFTYKGPTIKRGFVGGPRNKKMTMQDNMSSQLVSIGKVQDLGLVSMSVCIKSYQPQFIELY